MRKLFTSCMLALSATQLLGEDAPPMSLEQLLLHDRPGYEIVVVDDCVKLGSELLEHGATQQNDGRFINQRPTIISVPSGTVLQFSDDGGSITMYVNTSDLVFTMENSINIGYRCKNGETEGYTDENTPPRRQG